MAFNILYQRQHIPHILWAGNSTCKLCFDCTLLSCCCLPKIFPLNASSYFRKSHALVFVRSVRLHAKKWLYMLRLCVQMDTKAWYMSTRKCVLLIWLERHQPTEKQSRRPMRNTYLLHIRYMWTGNEMKYKHLKEFSCNFQHLLIRTGKNW